MSSILSDISFCLDFHVGISCSKASIFQGLLCVLRIELNSISCLKPTYLLYALTQNEGCTCTDYF